MRCFFVEGLTAVGLMIVFTGSGLASPANSKLLSLVPPGCAIVAGFENEHGPHPSGRLVLTTPNNRSDLDDWLALAGVDSQRRYDEVIEAASPNSVGDLREHLLLVSGRFDRARIFGAAELNGAQQDQYAGETVLVITPFAREKREMTDTRWLAIFENRTAILGTPLLVKQALLRYQTHADPDPSFAERLAQLRPDITSWNVLVSLPASARIPPHSVWARLLDDADVLLVGAHFASRIRVDFLVHATNNREARYFIEKAALFRDMFVPQTPQQAESSQPSMSRLENLAIEAHRVSGSITLSDQQFDEWIAHLSRPPAVSEPDRAPAIAGIN